ncbi:MAG: sulfatase-like hydrolase/transferase [Chthoniobacterales bacterium]|nr:sulfatase-like hydrolase/transferase [Chthoniobacterales bacterium]
MKTSLLPLSSLLAATIQTCNPLMAAEPSRPNIILIVADDLGWGDLGCYPKGEAWGEEAHISTPHMDALAATGVKCTQGYTTGMVCAPSRAGLISGQYEQRFGYYGFEDSLAPIPNDLKLLPEALREAGYRTGMIGKWHVSSAPGSWPLDRGFDRFFGFIGGQHDFYEANIGETMHGVGCSSDAPIYDQETPVAETKYLTEEFTDRAIEFMAQEEEKPFFLYIPYNTPHPPLQAPWEYLEKHASARPGGKFTNRDIARAMIENLDDNVGRLCAWLEEKGLRENTLIVLTSDNGGSDGGPGRMTQHNGGLKGRKGTYYEGGIRVPCIVNWPKRLPAGEIYTKPVSQLDFYPTFLAAAGAADLKTQPLDGVNLIPYLKGETKALPHPRMYWCLEHPGTWAVREGDWKLVREITDPNVLRDSEPRTVELQLYDLGSDAHEEHNLIESKPEVAQHLRQLFDDFRSGLKPALGTPEIVAEWKATLAERQRKPELMNVEFETGSPGHWRVRKEKRPAKPASE